MIESTKNQRVKDWRKLHMAKERKKQGRYLVEGHHLVEEAVRTNQEIELIILTKKALEQADYLKDQPLQLISPEVSQTLSQTESSQDIFALIKKEKSQGQFNPTKDRYLLLDAVQDPGNVGTLIRTAAAAAYDGVVLGTGSADPYNPKVIRASQGSIWQIDLFELDLEEAITSLKKQKTPVFASALDDQAESYHILANHPKKAIIVGNEGQGVRANLIDQADQTVYIPMSGPTESLNVAVAAGIMMFR